MGKRFLRLKEVKQVTGLSRSTIYDLISKDQFPKQTRLSPRTSGWVEAEIQQWADDRIAERDNSVAA